MYVAWGPKQFLACGIKLLALVSTNTVLLEINFISNFISACPTERLNHRTFCPTEQKSQINLLCKSPYEWINTKA